MVKYDQYRREDPIKKTLIILLGNYNYNCSGADRSWFS